MTSSSSNTSSSTSLLEQVLTELADLVLVVGSHATGRATDSSDIDLWPRCWWDDDLGETSTMKQVIAVLDRHELAWESRAIGDIHTVIDGVLVDIAERFIVDKSYGPDGDRGFEHLERWPVTVHGVRMEATYTDIENTDG